MSGFTGHVQIFSVSYSIFHIFHDIHSEKNMNDIHFMVYPNIMIYQHGIPPFFNDSIGVYHAGRSGSLATQGQMLEEVLQDKAPLESQHGGVRYGRFPTRLVTSSKIIHWMFGCVRMFHDLLTRNGKR